MTSTSNPKFDENNTLKWKGDIKKWEQALHDLLVQVADPGTASFAIHQTLPYEHTQNMNCVNKIEKNGTYIGNRMIGMPGSNETSKLGMTRTHFDKLSYEDALEVEIFQDGESIELCDLRPKAKHETCEFSRILRIELPMKTYIAKYEKDPFSNPRYMVREKDKDRLTLIETKFCEKLHIGCAYFGRTIHQQVLTYLETQIKYRQAKVEGRLDIMTILAKKAIQVGNVSSAPNKADAQSRDYLFKLQGMYCHEEKSLTTHLNTFENLVISMRECGFDREDRTSLRTMDGSELAEVDIRSDIDYMLGQILIWSVRDRFPQQMANIDSSLLVAPILHYQSAIALIDKWNREATSGLSGQAKRDKVKKANPKQHEKETSGTVLMVTNHASAQKEEEKNNKREKPNTKSIIRSSKYKEFLSKQTCEICNKQGHLGSQCEDPKATEERKTECFQEYKKRKHDFMTSERTPDRS